MLIPPEEELRVRHRYIAYVETVLQHHQAVCSLIRQWPKQYGIHQRENCGAGANAYGQNKDGNERESRVSAQQAQREAKILKKAVHNGPWGGVRLTRF